MVEAASVVYLGARRVGCGVWGVGRRGLGSGRMGGMAGAEVYPKALATCAQEVGVPSPLLMGEEGLPQEQAGCHAMEGSATPNDVTLGCDF